jgi:hypothetical protein
MVETHITDAVQCDVLEFRTCTLVQHVAELIIYLFTAIGFSPGGSGYSTCKQNMKLVTTKFKSGGLHEKHVVATWNLGNHLSICF